MTLFIIIRGIPGSGKTLFGRALSKKFSCAFLEPENINLKKFKTFAPDLLDEIPRRRKIYRFLLHKTVYLLSKGRSVVWAQPWRKNDRIDLTIRNIVSKTTSTKILHIWKKSLANLIKKISLSVIVIEMEVSSNVAKERVKKRNRDSKHNLKMILFAEYVKTFENFNLDIPYIKISGTDSIRDNVQIVKNLIETRQML